MRVALIEPLVEMTATLNVVVSINSTTVMQIPEGSQKMAKIFAVWNESFHAEPRM